MLVVFQRGLHQLLMKGLSIQAPKNDKKAGLNPFEQREEVRFQRDGGFEALMAHVGPPPFILLQAQVSTARASNPQQ